MKQTLNPRFLTLLCFILAIALLRIANSTGLTPFAHYSPIGALGLFGGAYFSSRWKAFALPILTLLVSDLVINKVIYQGKYGVMYEGWYWIYGIFAIIVLFGKVILQKINVQNVVLAAIIASVSHWILADTTVWIGGGTDLRTMLPLSKDWAGLQQCLIQGFPYMKNFLVGTLAYSGLMFGAFELLQVRFPKLAIV
ncbi:DUF6580 family putative transport protein [Arcicella sp. LKC2W]|uniref:DUF6580 family putative transport protein n=1 Tax=Arcicella sp. LKC2W TaxID=2984198 RepID=UPI002B20E63C|nr:DUF6580 family putative transport protein [Arcicella sp. LKC2W]MEA5458374.1 DUF6580 family putative transport protein [Arcicella sp. LKC2W]